MKNEKSKTKKAASTKKKRALDIQPATPPVLTFTEVASEQVPPAGPLVEMPRTDARDVLMIDLKSHERSAFAAYASDFHSDASQIEAFEAGSVASLSAQRVRRGTRRLIQLGLVQERTAYFVTELGARVAASGGITVTRPVAQDAAPVKAAS